MNFRLKDSLRVLAFGDISVYEKSGQYQMVVRQLVPKGVGDLQLAFERLKQQLAREGLFDSARKRPIPVLPQCIGLVTSPTGAAILDFLNIIGRRFPNVHIIIHPVRVQGQGAGQEIADAIDQLNALHAAVGIAPDVLVVTRGGGSIEDLWAFNEEVVARALARSKIPTISAIGHEIDFTIADFVADLRAPTPSAAAELVVKAKNEFIGLLREYQKRLDKDFRLRIGEVRQRLRELATSYVFRQPAELTRQYQQQVDGFRHRLRQAAASMLESRQSRVETACEKFKLLSPQAHVTNWKQRLEADSRRLDGAFSSAWREINHRLRETGAKLELLSPNSILTRGYSITRMADSGRIVRSVTAVKPGTNVNTMVLDGSFDSVVCSLSTFNEKRQEDRSQRD